jgi:hypothetical protein
MNALVGRASGSQGAVLDTTRGDSVATLLERLVETIAWHSTLLLEEPTLAALRPAELAPVSLAGSRRDVVASVASARRCFMQVKKASYPPAETLADGQLLIYFPDVDLADGAAELESAGFFDVHNVPPWALWLAYMYETNGANYLVSWVPPEWVHVAAQGIRVNPEACLRWFSMRDRALVNALDATGLTSWDGWK